jgi:hypothetical protein
VSRAAYHRDYYRRIRKPRGIKPRPESTVISVRTTTEKKALWKLIAGDQALSGFIAEIVDAYVAGLQETNAA